MHYSVILTPEPEGGFTITMPAFPGYVGFADTEEEALALAREGVAFELARLKERGETPPVETASPKVVSIAT
jgi:predicted RNase H-like HicB family nuclease